MNDKLIRDFNKFKNLIKELYEKYDGEPIDNEWLNYIKEGYDLLYPQKEQDVQQDDKPCENYIDNESGFACSLYCHFHQECDGITCKKDCDYYNKRGWVLSQEDETRD